MKLIKFTQTVCQPCSVLNMMLDQMGAEVDEARVLDTPEDLLQAETEFGVMSTPTMVLFDDDGKEIQRTVGIRPPDVKAILIAADKL